MGWEYFVLPIAAAAAARLVVLFEKWVEKKLDERKEKE